MGLGGVKVESYPPLTLVGLSGIPEGREWVGGLDPACLTPTLHTPTVRPVLAPHPLTTHSYRTLWGLLLPMQAPRILSLLVSPSSFWGNPET